MAIPRMPSRAGTRPAACSPVSGVGLAFKAATGTDAAAVADTAPAAIRLS